MDIKLDQWATVPPAGYPGTIAPPLAKRQAGWANGEEPPAGYFNHAFDALADTQNELSNLITGAGLTRSESDLSQVLQAVDKLIARRAAISTEVSNITQWQSLISGSFYGNAIAASPNVIVAVGEGVDPIRLKPMNVSGGWNWNSVVPDAGYGGKFRDVCWSTAFSRFVAVGTAGEIQDCDDEYSFVRRESGGNDWWACAAGGAPGAGSLVVVGDAGSIVGTTSGIIWHPRSTAHPGVSMFAVAYSPKLGMYVAVGASGKIQRATSDGGSWFAVASPIVSGNFLGIIWSTEHSLFFAWTSTNVFKSADAMTWSAATGVVTTGLWSSKSISTAVAMPGHLALFNSTGPQWVRLYRIDELNGAPENVVDLSLWFAGGGSGDAFERVVRIPPTSGLQFAGRLLAVSHSGRICATPYLG